MNTIDKSERKFIRNAALAGTLLVKSSSGIWFKPARVIYGKDGSIKADWGARKIPRAWRYEDVEGLPYAIIKGSIL